MRLRHLLKLLTVTAAVLVALTATASARTPRDFVGVSADDLFGSSPDYQTQTLQSMNGAGVGLIRQVFDWKYIERSPGAYDFSAYDAYVARLAQHGITVLPVLMNAPDFHAPVLGHGYAPPYDNASMARFAQALVGRYGPNGSLWSERPDVPKVPIRSWQVWNEPNLGVYWGKKRPNPRKYVAMLKTVGKAIKASDRGAEIVTAGIAPSKLSSAMPYLKFTKGMYKAGAKKYFDSFALNSYAKNEGELAKLLGSIRDTMNKSGDRKGKIWISELGWATAGPRHRFNVGARKQAALIRKSLKLIKKVQRSYRIRGLVYYAWRDLHPYAPNYDDLWGLHTGLVDVNGVPKPGFNAFGQGIRRLR
jgi:Beta-galactosidase